MGISISMSMSTSAPSCSSLRLPLWTTSPPRFFHCM
eukprot:CAMPEP_0197248228 /NCGR_PEP_ID=MMETSP1429-20130617/36648_1 /TAXON_ID=49237 /ORGANISM="Chaetoceros  sp., Strain UNC1202" /LENGTH=35 /DNA_ID= /DNA_START= /DNA_END= /DNA_ORIENTATION=